MFQSRHPLTTKQKILKLFITKKGWKRRFTAIWLRLMRLPGSSHAIAMGAACGTFMAFSPLIGLHTPLSIGAAALLKGNKSASFISTQVAGNPWFLPFELYLSFYVGQTILGTTDPVHLNFKSMTLEKLIDKPLDILVPMLLGSIPVGLFFAFIAYFVMRHYVHKYHMNRFAQKGTK